MTEVSRGVLEAECGRLRAALVECAKLAGDEGAIVGEMASCGAPIEEWVVGCVRELRDERDEATQEAAAFARAVRATVRS